MTVKKTIKRSLIVVVSILLIFAAYVEIVNRNSFNMSYRQKFLKAVYPVFMWWSKLRGKNAKSLTELKPTMTSFYTLHDTLINGDPIDFDQFKGKKLMLINTASNCGYTNQYADLELLHQQYKDKLEMIAFPSNDFGEQERGSNDEIQSFCQKNFGLSFMLMQKSSVVKGPEQNPVYQWLTDPAKNGWNDQQPSWNFCKYIIDENGRLVNFFGSAIEPHSKEIINVIEK